MSAPVQPAQRGDLCVLNVRHGSAPQHTHCYIAIVNRVGPDGRAETLRTPSQPKGHQYTVAEYVGGRTVLGLWVLPSMALADYAGCLTALVNRQGSATFASVEEARAFLAPFKRAEALNVGC